MIDYYGNFLMFLTTIFDILILIAFILTKLIIVFHIILIAFILTKLINVFHIILIALILTKLIIVFYKILIAFNVGNQRRLFLLLP